MTGDMLIYPHTVKEGDLCIYNHDDSLQGVGHINYYGYLLYYVPCWEGMLQVYNSGQTLFSRVYAAVIYG